jgi:hypothetical protein
MDNFSARQAHDERGFESGAMLGIGEPFDSVHADDNLGDEAAFPSTWQQLAGADAQHD